MKVYRGKREADGELRVFVEQGTSSKLLHHIIHHSPTGFECGYGGSGPADLALSILADFRNVGQFGDYRFKDTPIHPIVYQEFKDAFIAQLPRDKDWEIKSDEIATWFNERETSV